MAILTITPSQVSAAPSAKTRWGLAHETLTAGQTLYYNTTSKRYGLAQSDATVEEAIVEGYALASASQGQPIHLLTEGDLTVGAGAAPAVGTVYILSATPGGTEPVADLLSGRYVVPLAVGKTGNILSVRRHNSGVLKA